MEFREAIKTYLERKAAEDELFAKTFAKKNKSFDECIKYIYGEVTKMNKGRHKCIGVCDEDVYNMAVHYYDEDDIAIEGSSVSGTAHAQVMKPKKKTSKKKSDEPVFEISGSMFEIGDSDSDDSIEFPMF
jgi:hypothetical protein